MRASIVVACLVLFGCSADTPSTAIVSKDGDAAEAPAAVDSTELACRQDDAGQGLSVAAAEPTYSTPNSTIEARPFRCLRLLGVADISASDNGLHVVNVSRDSTEAPGQLHMPLHEIKTKGFLRNRPLAILSDGKRFAALENECREIKASGIADVIALLPEAVSPAGSGVGHVAAIPEMTPQEFIVERAYGVWRIVNLTTADKLESPLLTDTDRRGLARQLKAQGSSRVGLVRTLLVFDDVRSQADSAPLAAQLRSPAISGQTFVLEGGLAGLQRFEAEATAMAQSLARPRIDERGCAG